jgi:ubiquitin-conjugating enzyme E2 M
MIKLFSLKQQKAEEEKAAAEGKTKASPGQIRMQKGPRARAAPVAPHARARGSRSRHAPAAAARADLSELTLGKGVEIEFHKGADELMEFKVHIQPDDGMYRGGRFTFDFKVASTYPHDAPKVTCETLVRRTLRRRRAACAAPGRIHTPRTPAHLSFPVAFALSRARAGVPPEH